MKVELGAGARAHDGFLAYDVNPKSAGVIGDAKQLPFRTGSLTALRAVDVLEHISYRDTDATLAEWARVCAPDAHLYVQVPDADEIMRWYLLEPKRLIRGLPPELPQTALAGAQWRLLGGHADGAYVDSDGDWRWNAHFSLFSFLSLATHLDKAGFRVLEMPTNGHPNLCCEAVRR